MTRTTATTPKPRKGAVYASRDSRRSGLRVLVEKVSRKDGDAIVLNDLGQRYAIRLDRLNPKHHWGFVAHMPALVGTPGADRTLHYIRPA